MRDGRDFPQATFPFFFFRAELLGFEEKKGGKKKKNRVLITTITSEGLELVCRKKNKKKTPKRHKNTSTKD